MLDCWEEPNLSPGVLKRTLSHIWLRLYLHIQFPMQSYSLQWGVHRWNSKDPWRKKQGTPQTTLSIHVHIQQTGHTSTYTSFNIIGREDQGQARTIKESIFIRVNNPTLNQTLVRSTSVIYGTEFFLIPQGLNWALPNSLAHKHK